MSSSRRPCARGSRDEIVACGAADISEYRVRRLAANKHTACAGEEAPTAGDASGGDGDKPLAVLEALIAGDVAGGDAELPLAALIAELLNLGYAVDAQSSSLVPAGGAGAFDVVLCYTLSRKKTAAAADGRPTDVRV